MARDRPLTADRSTDEASRRLVDTVRAAGVALGGTSSARIAAGATIPGLALALALDEGWVTLTSSGATTAATLINAVVVVIIGRRLVDGDRAQADLGVIREFEAAELRQLADGE